jgi:hypothetical protein
MKILHSVFSVGHCNEASLGTVWDLRAAGDTKASRPAHWLWRTNTFWCTSSFNFDQVFIKAPGLLDFTVCIHGKG